MIKNNLELIGNTPLVELKNIEEYFKLKSRIFAKVEKFNLTGSVKDRVALRMIEELENDVKINKDTLIIEPTSGNTGIGLAAIGKLKGYKVTIIMPDSMSIERMKIIKGYGAELILTPGSLGMKGAIEKANELHKNNPNSIIAGQFTNMANVRAHYYTTAREIYQDLPSVDVIVAGIGTGGTITGITKYLKEQKEILSVGVEPLSSPIITKGISGPHKIQGIGAGFIPDILDLKIIDRIITCSNEDAVKYSRMLFNLESLFVGISSGASLYAGLTIAQEMEGKDIVVILPDGGEKYLSTALMVDE